MATPDQKHPCPDCRQCQWCSEDRCRLCLRTTSSCARKLSIAEQIAFYEQLNGSGKCCQQAAKSAARKGRTQG